MNVLIVFAHPEPQSFNGAMRDTAVEEFTRLGHAVRVSDLYAMGFDPVVSRADFLETADPDFFKPQREQQHASDRDTFAPAVRAELEKLFWADLILFQSPVWWWSLPAILKGWCDRVLVMGRVYGGSRMYEQGVLRGKRAMLAMTQGGPGRVIADGSDAEFNATLHHVHEGVFAFCGLSVLAPFVVEGPARLSHEGREEALAAWRERIAGIELEPPMQLAPLVPGA